jgi:hypothetical protein
MEAKDLLVWVTKRGNLEWSRFTEPYIRYYCERHGYNLVFADVNHIHNVATSWTKCKAFKHVTAPFILFMDLDIFPLPNAPAIHEHLCYGMLNFVEDDYLRGSYGRAKERQYNLPDNSMRWNCGLMGISRGYADWLENVYERRDQDRDLWWEQSEINLAIYRDNITVNSMSWQWNALVKMKPDKTYDTVADLDGAYFIHLCGHANKDALAFNIEQEIRETYGQPWPQNDEGLARNW